MSIINKPEVRWTVDIAMIITILSGAYAYGQSEQEQARLVQDVENLEVTIVEQAVIKTDVKYLQVQNSRLHQKSDETFKAVQELKMLVRSLKHE